MSAIPLLRLPSFAQDAIVSSLDPAQVLGLTLRSKVMHRIVSRSKYSRIPVMRLGEHSAYIEILTAEESLQYICHNPDLFWKVNEIQCFKFRNGFYLVFRADREKSIIEHLLSIFNISQFEMRFITKRFEGSTIFDHVKKFTTVYMAGMSLTASQLKFLLEDIQTDSLTIFNMPDVIEYRKDFVFNHRNISIYGFPNIQFSSIFSMKSEYFSATLNVTDSTIQDIVGFIKHWCLGGMEHFKRLSIEYENLTDQIENAVLQKIDEMENVTIQEATREKRKLIRTDGKRANVTFCGMCFELYVFN